ncbi:MAG: peptidase M16 [Lysobacteraceae bacterium SCN 69-123]|uniref:M16 family metallopeptidase n=1 Tax=Stenotrophomonas acidaminiphila TaxID=128780 RepID=UPI00086BE0FF|nr:pitrilysin family protein [Stenotrophomonas acidaminiphila]MBN8801351.1 insulinase family protein [Stenotrophomonas acidaminiphila]MDF9440617.1 insulinase family protein [Stenotrophomonas acidaminiphila]ODU44055.1 MAG: peptidase M16 [Xanthomonadaceae bacterium SCN 69-123]OJY72719.1 MAG: peptidase M16 [Stenotrophomonas sp. 69-14]
MNAATPRTALLTAALGLALGGFAGVPLPAAAKAPAAATAVDIPFEEFTLPNGLRVVVHTDRKAPIVAVNIWYHVGAKDEPSGRTGFAHLFEHLMFQGSENHSGEFFEPFKQVGATDQNGTTNTDRTNYFQNVPTTALDMALWMESDRMGHLLGAIDQAALDEQRGVVQNEKRQGENQPYGQVWDKLTRALYPAGHPYHHGVIGSMNDLNAASLEDVKTWFRTWYGPNNAVLVLAGDIDVATAKEKVARYFGDIPAGPTMAQPKVDVARRAASTREVMTDKVPQARIYRAWNVAQVGTTDIDQLQLFAQVLGGAKSSRLDQRLLHQDKLVDNIGTMVGPSQLGSNFIIMATVKQGVDPAKVEAVIDEELKRLVAEGPSAEELARAKTAFRAGFIRGIERIGGFGGKADALAECAVYEGDPGCFRTSLSTIRDASVADVKAVGAKWLGVGDHTLVVEPGERVALAELPSGKPAPFNVPAVDAKYRVLPSQVDRSAGVPQTATFPELKFPQLQRATLKNGTRVVLAERHDIPVVQFSYEFQGGFTADQGRKPGTANFTMGMLDEGAGKLGSLAFADAADALGARIAAGASLDGANVYLSALKENLAPSLALYADALRAPRFDQGEIDRIKATWIAGIKQEKVNPNAVAMRVLPPLLYGKGHPYAIPFTGSGDEAAIQALGRDDLLSFHKDWVRPENATLIVVGDTTLKEIVPLLDRQLGDWKGEGAAPRVGAPSAVARPDKARVYLIDQPGAVQANLFAGQVVPSTMDAGATRFDIANGVLGGDFTSRLNMNLREDKHWSYGARSSASGALGQRPWMAVAPVQIDKTSDAMKEMQAEISQFASGQRPPTTDEVARIRNIQTLSLPGAYETASAVMNTIGGIVRYQRPDDYVFKRKAEIEAMTPAQVAEAARTLDPARLTWVVVGDLKQTEAPVRALGLGEVVVVDSDGNPVPAAK